MSGFVMSVLEPVFLHLCSCFGGEVNYVWNLEKNLVALEDTMKVLRARRADVLTKVQRQESEGLQRVNEVEVWLTSVENIQNQVYELLLPRRDELERLCLCTKNLSSSHSYGKRVFEMLKEVEDLKSKGVFGVVAGPPSNGCKVVFSTRSREVCGQMGVDDPMQVKCLESDEAWDFFRSNVGKMTLESDPDILEVACQVARECRGLPLALNIIGKNMAWKRTVEEWEQAIDTLASSAAEFPGMEEEDLILPILKYSYDSLKGEHVKSCFLYCALFTSIEKEKLVDCWICEGFIDEKQGLKKAKNQGYGIIGTLIQACLLTEEEECELHVRMHDVVREMALWIASDFGKDKERCIVKARASLRQVPMVENWRYVRRMSLMDNKIENISDSPTCPELTTLLLHNNNILNISGEFFKSIPKLVVLDLSDNKILDELPKEISKLVSLRYLDLSGNRGIQRLFTCLLELKSLICLNLERMGLTSISGISTLLNLRTLRLKYNDMEGDVNVIEELQLLQLLEVVTIDISSILVVDQLLNAYRVANAIQVLHIRLLEEESILILPDMPLLTTLDMSRSEMVEINVKRSTSSLNKSPTTVSFQNLSSVTLRDCHGLKDLTWLLVAPNLRALELDSLNQVEDIISKEKADVFTEEAACTIIPFRKLEFFQLYGLPKLKSIYWSPLPFPLLMEFNIYNCPNLRKLPLDSTSGSSIELAIHNGEQYYRDKVEWEDEATKERFLRCINPSLYRATTGF